MNGSRHLCAKEVAGVISSSAAYVKRHVHLFRGAYIMGNQWRFPPSSIACYERHMAKRTLCILRRMKKHGQGAFKSFRARGQCQRVAGRPIPKDEAP